METHVYANGKEFCSRAADGTAKAAGPDPCWSPPPPDKGPRQVNYRNTAYASSLQNGSSTVFVCGSPIAKKDISFLATSTGNEAATFLFGMGVKTHVIKGRAYFVKWSDDVKIEGLNVCRHQDAMTHNHA